MSLHKLTPLYSLFHGSHIEQEKLQGAKEQGITELMSLLTEKYTNQIDTTVQMQLASKQPDKQQEEPEGVPKKNSKQKCLNKVQNKRLL